jgi:hypothetical protein
MTITIDQRLTELENDCNRILEALQDVAIVTDGDEYEEIEEGELLDLERRVSRSEAVLASLIHKANLVRSRS